jgi:hypothetical protein
MRFAVGAILLSEHQSCRDRPLLVEPLGMRTHRTLRHFLLLVRVLEAQICCDELRFSIDSV